MLVRPTLICVFSVLQSSAPASAHTTPTIDHSTISMPASSRTRRFIAFQSIAFSIFLVAARLPSASVLGAARHHIGRFQLGSVPVRALLVTTRSHLPTL